MSTFLGADISDYQSGFDAAKYAKKQRFIIFKATEGVTVDDKFFESRRKDAAKAGLLVGIYHFAHPAHNSANDEARHFIKAVGGKLRKGEWPLLDLEVNREKDGAVLSNRELNIWVDEWTRIVGSELKRKGGIYSFQSYLEESPTKLTLQAVNGWWLHVANYSPRTGVPAPWKKWTMWQFTGDGDGPSPHSLYGISDKNIDVNRFEGTLQELKALGGFSSVDPLTLLTRSELKWVKEYDALKKANKNRPRRVILRAKMRIQAALIKRKAHADAKSGGWHKYHRDVRYHELHGRSS